MINFQLKELIGPLANVRITAFDSKTGEIIVQRESHNILTDIGRTWLRNVSSSTSYANADANGGEIPLSDSKTNERPRFVAFGVGGSLSSDATKFFATQEEIASVNAIEDFVAIVDGEWLKELDPQTVQSDSFPDNFNVKYITDILESEVSFSVPANNISKSFQSVGTNVPITEAGLYLSGADKTSNTDAGDNTSRLIAYNIFSPIFVTPNMVLRVEWEFLY